MAGIAAGGVYMPKSSTTRQKVMSQVACNQIPGMCAWCVSVCGQVGYELAVCQYASLWQAVHSTADFHKDKSVADEV
jgi:hypothetical protein